MSKNTGQGVLEVSTPWSIIESARTLTKETPSDTHTALLKSVILALQELTVEQHFDEIEKASNLLS